MHEYVGKCAKIDKFRQNMTKICNRMACFQSYVDYIFNYSNSKGKMSLPNKFIKLYVWKYQNI